MPQNSKRPPSRPLCYVRKGGCVVETCTNTINDLPLLRPSPEVNERIFGALGRAAEYYGVDIHAFGILSTHYHLLYSVENALQMSRFQSHLNSNIAREVGRLHGQKDKFWARRYRKMDIGDEREDQRARLKYCLAQAVQAGLVASPLDWPAPTAAEALLNKEPVVGFWFSRTKEYDARRRELDYAKYDFATRYEIELKPLPAFRSDTPEEYQAMVAEVLIEIKEEAATKRGDRPVLGADAVQAQDPCQRLSKQRKKSPAPMLFFSKRPEARKVMRDDYEAFRQEYMLGSQRLIKAAEQGYRLKPERFLPEGSSAPTILKMMLEAEGFNPKVAFPTRCFPRAWPFIDGELPPPPPTPPTRTLVLAQVEDGLKIVYRGEIPTVRLARNPYRDPLIWPNTLPVQTAPPPEFLSSDNALSREPP